MLKENPKIGQLIIGLEDEFWEDGYPFVLKDKKYVIVGISGKSKCPYYLYDGEKIYIDEHSWHLYELVKEESPKDASWFFNKIMEVKGE